MTSTALAHLDEPTDESPARQQVFVRGWVFGTTASVTRVHAHVGEEAPVALDHHWTRPDVAAAHDSPEALLSGFQGWVTMSADRPVRLRVCADLDDGSVHAVGETTLAPMPPAASRPRVLVWARSLDHGGSQLLMLDYTRELVDRGAEVTVVAAHDGGLREGLEASGVGVELCAWSALVTEAGYDDAVGEGARWARGRFDVIIGTAVTSFAAVDVGAAASIPTLLRVGEAEPIETVAHWLAMPWTPALGHRARRAFALADAVVVNSLAAARVHQRRGWHANYLLLEQGVDLDQVDERTRRRRRRTARQARDVGTSTRLVLCLGTLWPVKGQAILVEAFARVAAARPSLRLALVGQADPGYADAIGERLRVLGLEDRVLVSPFEPDPQGWLDAADALVCSSVSESTSSSVLEAMAQRLPVLATRTGGNPEVVDAGVTGWLCEPSDVLDLARGLDALAAAPAEELARLGAAGRRVVESRFDRARNLASWCDLVLGTAAGGPARLRQ